jgi:hypothetical protein
MAWPFLTILELKGSEPMRNGGGGGGGGKTANAQILNRIVMIYVLSSLNLATILENMCFLFRHKPLLIRAGVRWFFLCMDHSKLWWLIF